LPAILSGLLLWAAFFPLDLGALAYVALVPWLTLVRAPSRGWRLYLAGYLGGFVFFLVAVQWIRVAHPMMHLSWLGLALACPTTWLIGLWLLRRLDGVGVPLAASVPLVWVAMEFTRSHFPTGFPFLAHVGLYQMVGFGWYGLGYTQHDFLSLIQIADLGGVYAVSFVVAAINGLAAEWLLRLPAVRNWLRWNGEPGDGNPAEVPHTGPARPIGSSVAVAALFVASVAYGLVRLDHPEFAPGPRVAAIQGNVPQAEKNQRGPSLGQTYGELHLHAEALHPWPDLIVWPETCFPMDWVEAAPGSDPPDDFRWAADKCAAEFNRARPGPPILLGLNSLEWEDGRAWKYNSAVLLDVRRKKVARYDKMHLVPFGEYVPFKDSLPWMQTFTPYKWDYSCRPGEHWTRFPLTAADGKTYTFGCLICYEDSDPYLARQYACQLEPPAEARPPAKPQAWDPYRPVDFLVNISNDGWFDGTEEHEEHLAICRFRAIEARRSVVRAVNMGISAVIDPDGRVIALPRLIDRNGTLSDEPASSWSASKKVEGVVCAAVPIDTRESCFARLGDWVPGLSWAAIAAALAVSVLRGRRGPAISPAL
jgi:apolipoprotein N-acyltransferase